MSDAAPGARARRVPSPRARSFPSAALLTGTGDVLEPEDGLIGIGSGGSFALAAARALMEQDSLAAEAIALKAMEIAAGICIYTNDNIVLESIPAE